MWEALNTVEQGMPHGAAPVAEPCSGMWMLIRHSLSCLVPMATQPGGKRS